jgi:uncharacterized SAM-binding protein YcdF (DUF218 family)
VNPVENGLFAWLESSARDTTKPETTYDVVVLLGGMIELEKTKEHPLPEYNENVGRLVATFAFLREGRARYAIVSGGADSPGGLTEAEQLRDQLVDWGIDRERIIVEDKARNTHENATYSAAIIRERGFSSIAIVTSAFHMKRSIDCFHAVGLDPDTLPTAYHATTFGKSFGLEPRARYLDESTYAIRELFGRLVYWIVGYAKSAPA